jgi:hypothetical protein
VEHLAIGKCTIGIHALVDTTESLRLQGTVHETHTVSLKERFKEIRATMFEHVFNIIIARIIKEAIIEQVSLFKFDWRSLVADHEFLETQVAQIPRITLLIRHELRQTRRCHHFGTIAELPYDAITR